MPKQNSPERVAVIYFHGIGQQRRYEETARLVESLEKAAAASAERAKAQPNVDPTLVTGFKFDTGLEPHGTPDDRIGYLEITPVQHNHQYRNPIRLYEAYWAPIASHPHKLTEMWSWLFGLAIKPLRISRTPWRLRQRWRRSTLLQFRDAPPSGGGAKLPFDQCKKLIKAYEQFDEANPRRAYKEGNFEQFIEFLGEWPLYNDTDPVTEGEREELQRNAKRWQSYYGWTEFKNSVAMFTLLLPLIGVAAWLASFFDISFSDLAKGNFISAAWRTIQALQGYEILTAILPVLALVVLYQINKFMKSHLGDVKIWAAYEETGNLHKKRGEILQAGVEVLKHVLSNGQEDLRVVIVGHSLGATVAHDTILELARVNRAYSHSLGGGNKYDLSKISHFVTMGSPIDKIYYLFESIIPKNKRYAETMEDFRGDFDRPPFLLEGSNARSISWINFWDIGDPISGPLHTPNGSLHKQLATINVHNSNLRFPSPAASHDGYFNNLKVMEPIFEIIVNNENNLDCLSPGTNPALPKLILFLGGLLLWALGIGLILSSLSGLFQAL